MPPCECHALSSPIRSYTDVLVRCEASTVALRRTLEPLRALPDKWATLFRCRECGSFWCEEWPFGERHGGGAPCLFLIEAIDPDQWARSYRPLAPLLRRQHEDAALPNGRCEACRYPLPATGSMCPECGCDSAGQQRLQRLRRLWRKDVRLLLCIALVAGLWFGVPPLARGVGSVVAWLSEPWTDYSPAQLAAASSRGQGVVLFFDARWAIVGDRARSYADARNALPSQARDLGFVPLRVDLTGSNPAGLALLGNLGRTTIPAFFVLDHQGRVVSSFDRPEDTAKALSAYANQRGP